MWNFAGLLIALLLTNVYVYAQEIPIDKKFGFKAGVNYSNTNFDRGYLYPGRSRVQSENKASVTLGFLLNLTLSNSVSIQPEYLYSNRKSFLTQNASSLNLNYLCLPVLLNVKIGDRFSVQAGPQVDLLIHATKTEGGIKTDITHDTEERNIAVAAGFRYDVIENLFVELRYMHGLSNVGIGQRSDVDEFKFQVFELCAGVRF